MTEDESYNVLNPFRELHELENMLDPEPLVYESEEEWLAYINNAAYEQDKYRPGVCIGILVDENLSKGVPQEDQRIRIEIFAEAKRGKTPSSGGFDEPTAQTIVPNTGSPSFDKYSKNPNAYAC